MAKSTRQDSLRAQIGPFVIIPCWLLDRCQDAHALRLYAFLMRHANTELRAWPKRPALLKALGVSSRSFDRALAELKRTGGVVTELRHHPHSGFVEGVDYVLIQVDPGPQPAAASDAETRANHQIATDGEKAIAATDDAHLSATDGEKATANQNATGGEMDAAFSPPAPNQNATGGDAIKGRTRSTELDPEEQERERASGAQPSLLSVQIATPTPEDFRQLWNETTTLPLPRCLALTADRRRRAVARIAERPIDEWRAIMARIEGSSFCRGQNDRGWVASFTWLIKSAEPAVKVLEGLYDNREKAERPFTARELDEARQWLRAVGGCRHDPRCSDYPTCVATFIRNRRGANGAAA